MKSRRRCRWRRRRRGRGGFCKFASQFADRIAGTRGDELGTAFNVLVDILAVVGVIGDESFFGGKEGATVVCEEEAVLAGVDVEVGGAPEGLQETQRSFSVAGS